jgi:hypothetical protein
VYSGEHLNENWKVPNWSNKLGKAHETALQLAAQYNDNLLERDTGRNPQYVGNAVFFDGEKYQVSLPSLLTGASGVYREMKGIIPQMTSFYRRNWNQFEQQLSLYFDVSHCELDGDPEEINTPELIDEDIVKDEVIRNIGEENSLNPRLYRKWDAARSKLRYYALDDDLTNYESRREINELCKAAREYYDRMNFLKGQCTSAAEQHQAGYIQGLFEAIQKARRSYTFTDGFKVSDMRAFLQTNEFEITDTALSKFMKRAYEIEDVSKEKRLIRLVKPKKYPYSEYRKRQVSLTGFCVNSYTNTSKARQADSPPECQF